MTHYNDSDNDYYTTAEIKAFIEEEKEELREKYFDDSCKIYDNMKEYLENNNISFILDKCSLNDFLNFKEYKYEYSGDIKIRRIRNLINIFNK